MADKRGFFKQLITPTTTGIKEGLLRRLSFDNVIVGGLVVSLGFLANYAWKNTGAKWWRKRVVVRHLTKGSRSDLRYYLYECGEARTLADADELVEKFTSEYFNAVEEARVKSMNKANKTKTQDAGTHAVIIGS